MKRLLILLLTFGLVAGACGGSDDVAEAQAAEAQAAADEAERVAQDALKAAADAEIVAEQLSQDAEELSQDAEELRQDTQASIDDTDALVRKTTETAQRIRESATAVAILKGALEWELDNVDDGLWRVLVGLDPIDPATSHCADFLESYVPSAGSGDTFAAWAEKLTADQKMAAHAWEYASIYGDAVLTGDPRSCMPHCPYVPDEIIVPGSGLELGEDEFAENITSEALEALGFSSYQVSGTDALDLAIRLRGEGLDASPNYLVFPAQGRMFFPGAYPENVSTPMPLSGSDNTDEGLAPIYIIDTGVADGEWQLGLLPEQFLELPNGDLLTDLTWDRLYLDRSKSPGSALVAGHGTFIASIIHEISPDTPLLHMRLNPEAHSAAWDIEDVVVAAANVRALHDSHNGEWPMVSNLSFGATFCSSQDGLIDSSPLASAVANYLLSGENDIVIAAAGNPVSLHGDPVTVYPASFTGDELRAVDGSDAENRTYNLVSVGAEDGQQDWSAEGDVQAQGCHEGNHPGGDYTYPPNGPTVRLDQEVKWCGTSFATASVSAAIALQIASGKGDSQAALGADLLLALFGVGPR